MSERTTIGGTVYESIGSSNSNLLLKCNGIARILWGGKLIDLIKNGKLASENYKQPLVFTVNNELDINQDGIYILQKDDSIQIFVCKDKVKYNLTNSELYIAAGKKQELTTDQKHQALSNIGLYYNTYEELEKASIDNGIAYVVDTKTLYIITNKVIEKFLATVKSITTNNHEFKDIIDGSTNLVLSVLGDLYIILADKRVMVNRSIYVKNSELIGSENANSNTGYRLFIDGGTSILEVDELRVRNGIPYHEYTEITYDKLLSYLNTKSIVPHLWYLITDFQNHWKLPKQSKQYRPILIRALTNHSFYEIGELFEDRRVKLKYDIYDRFPIHQVGKDILGYDLNGEPIYNEYDTKITSKGRITWMCDENGNEANFDFLDYTDKNKEDLTLLYNRTGGVEGKTIFPPGSYNNKLTVYNLYGTVVDKNGNINNEKTTTICFGEIIKKGDEKIINPLQAEFHDNEIECKNKFIIHPKCSKFYNNKLIKVGNVLIETDIYDSLLTNAYWRNDLVATIDLQIDGSEIPNVDNINNSYDMIYSANINYEEGILEDFSTTKHDLFLPIIFKYPIIGSIFEGLINTEIYTKILNCKFGIVTNSILGSTPDIPEDPDTNIETLIDSIIKSSLFKNIYNCSFDTLDNDNKPQTIQDVSCLFDIHNCKFEYRKNAILYDISVTKEFLFVTTKGLDGLTKYQIKVLKKLESTFFRGMIVMHFGKTAIPEGWAICDGSVHKYDGEEIETPNLVNRFIKGVADSNLTGEINNQDLIHETTTDESGKEVTVWTNLLKLKPEHLPEHQHQFEANVSINPNQVISEVNPDLRTTLLPTSGDTTDFEYIGNVTSVLESITGTVSGTIKSSNQEDLTIINIEPQSYALIFIMKL